MKIQRSSAAPWLAGSLLLLAACGGGGDGSSPTYSVSVTVSGLQAGKTVVFVDNGTDNLAVSTNGIAAFSTKLPSGEAYSVGVATPPVGQSCTVASREGTVGNQNILLGVSCAINSYSVGGTVAVSKLEPVSSCRTRRGAMRRSIRVARTPSKP